MYSVALLLCSLLALHLCAPHRSEAAKSEVEFIFENCSCTLNEPRALISSLDCSLGKSAKRRTLNVSGMLARDIHNFRLNFMIVLPRHGGDFVLLNLTNIDGCELVAKKKNQVTLLRLLRSELERYSNIPKHCPLLKRTNYYIRNFRIDLKQVPAFSIVTDLNVFIDVMVDRNRIMQAFVKGRISRKNGRELKLFGD